MKPKHATKPSICLVMIVKDEAPRIARALKSVIDHIDYYVILDTGSTDGTEDIIKRSLEGVNGMILHTHWQNFGYARTEAIMVARAQSECDYALVLDADNTLHAEAGAFDNLTADSYLIKQELRHTYHYMKILLKMGLNWEYPQAVHERAEAIDENEALIT